uniref:Uncharacterized protein n=1 Tax=Anopheles culicifacies TaxID=139723 RepID=A0A182MKV0_9DIPT
MKADVEMPPSSAFHVPGLDKSKLRGSQEPLDAARAKYPNVIPAPIMIPIEAASDRPIPTKYAIDAVKLYGIESPVKAPPIIPSQSDLDFQFHSNGFQDLAAEEAPIKLAIRVYQGHGRIPSIHVRARILLLRIHLIEPSDVGIVQSGAIVVQTRLRFPLLSRVQIRKLTVKIGPEASEYLAIGKIIVSRHYFSTRYHQPDRSFVIRDYSVQLVITQESNQLLVLVDDWSFNFVVKDLTDEHRIGAIVHKHLSRLAR